MFSKQLLEFEFKFLKYNLVGLLGFEIVLRTLAGDGQTWSMSHDLGVVVTNLSNCFDVGGHASHQKKRFRFRNELKRNKFTQDKH